MKVLFLDIDGVLNGYNWQKSTFRKLYMKVHGLKKSDLTTMFDPFRLKWISKLVRKYPDLKIVLSSSWRTIWDNHPELNIFLKKYNIEIFSMTTRTALDIDSTEKIDWTVCQRCIDNYASLFNEDWPEERRKKSFLKYARGNQILNWIKQNSTNEDISFAILEDDYQDVLCYESLKSHTVVTKFYGKKYGIRKNHYKKVCKILENL